MKRTFTKLFAILLIAFSTNIYSQQPPNFQWANQMTGPASDDEGRSVVTDAAGNVYSTGTFSGTVDFDPGVGVFTLTSTSDADVYVSKVDASGLFVWAKAFTGSGGNDIGTSITVDPAGNILTTGYFYGTVDFDPGAGVSNLTSAGVEDIFVSKLSSSGNFIWAKAMGGTITDEGHGIAADAGGNVYTTGSFRGTADFDPGAGVSNLNSGAFPAVFVSKLDASGNFVWAKAMGGSSGNDFGRAISLDASGNVYTTGMYTGTEDFDPNAGTFNLTSVGGDDIFISKLDPSGNFVFAKSIGGTAQDNGLGIEVDGSGNIYTTGFFFGTCDFDPGAGTFNLSATGSSFIFVSKLDPSGNFAWAKAIGGATGNNTGYSIISDAAGNVYTTGYFEMMFDFDPGTGIFNMSASGFGDVFIWKLDGAGNFGWAYKFGGFGSNPDKARGVYVDGLGNVYTTGVFYSTVDFNPTGTTYTLTAANSTGDIFVHKMCQLANTPLALLGPTTVCQGSTVTFSVAPVAGALSYLWTLPGGWTGTSTTNTISAVVTTTNNLFKISSVNACGTSGALITTVAVQPALINAGPDYTLSCNQGQVLNVVVTPSNPTSVSWSPTVGLSSSTVLTPTAVPPNVPTPYIVTATLSNGCTVKDTVILTPFVPTPSICIVTADSANKFNEVYWDKASYPALDSMIIFREVSTNTYKQIGAVSRKALSYFIDTTRSVGPANGDPNITTYRYKIQMRDTCGRYGAKSLWHNTVYFTHTGSTFQWNNYMIEGNINPVQTYSLMVWPVYSVTTTYSLVGTTAGTQSQLNDPNYNVYQSTADWRVFANLGYSCTPTFMWIKTGGINPQTGGKTATKSSSNIQNNRPSIGIKENSGTNANIKIYPNPNHGEVTVNLSNLKENTSIEIYNALGQLVHKEKVNNTTTVLNLQKLANGIYQMRILEKGSVIKHEKIVKE